MHLHTHEIYWSNYSWILTNQRVVYWGAEEALILSDLHIGKAAHFRKHGIALPTQVQQADLARLKYLMEHFGAKKLIIVGDMIHAQSNVEVMAFGEFLKSIFPVQIILIKGNHDKLKDEFCLQLGVHEVYTQWLYRGIRFTHENQADSTLPQLSGHIHPGYELFLPTRKSLRLPAFVIHPDYFILPAFSTFTGLDTKTSFPQAHYFPFHKEGFIL
ncbi:MAG: ligase-associated DNA damage response endonuclease PdeM [Pedobacter sp.]|nr:MAG: ligase-associated DNA damage response endonuclease PdeM [Pedobacter sp.]